MVALEKILEIENDEQILRFKCPETGYLLWPFIRNTFIRFIMNDILSETPLISVGSSPHSRKAYVSILRACAHNIINKKNMNGPILISSSGSHVLRNGRYFNRLSDDFALAAKEQTVTLETLFTDWHWPFPRHNEKILFDTPLSVCSSFYRRFFAPQKHADIAEALVKFAAQRARHLFDWSLSEEREKRLILGLSKNIASFPMRRHLYLRLFKKTGAQIFIRQLACYGGDSSIMNVVAHDLGLVTAEYQHGAISSGHDAYNFAEVLRSSEEYKKTLPQYFLGYGKWWIDQINVPIKKVCIGNPFRTESLKERLCLGQKKKDVLVLGGKKDSEKYLSLCSFLAQNSKIKLRIVFRPHPLDKDRVLRKYGKASGSFFIEGEKDIYQALETADVVVSERSTGLFEAIGLKTRVFLWETAKSKFTYTNGHPFTTFSNAEDLTEKILDGESGKINSSIVEEFWTPNWKENYMHFLQNACPTKNQF